MRWNRLNQHGDTIVEVLVAMTVIATVLTGAFFVSRNSLQDVRDSEERAQAVNILQGQIELLRNVAENPATGDVGKLNNSSPFCMAADGTIITSTSACQNLGENGLYTVSIDNLTKGACNAPEPCTFLATIDWDKVGGGQSRVQLYYRVAVGS